MGSNIGIYKRSEGCVRGAASRWGKNERQAGAEREGQAKRRETSGGQEKHAPTKGIAKQEAEINELG